MKKSLKAVRRYCLRGSFSLTEIVQTGLFLSAFLARDLYRIFSCKAANAHVVLVALKCSHKPVDAEVAERISTYQPFDLFMVLAKDKFLLAAIDSQVAGGTIAGLPTLAWTSDAPAFLTISMIRLEVVLRTMLSSTGQHVCL